jgi:hypothetical protein
LEGHFIGNRTALGGTGSYPNLWRTVLAWYRSLCGRTTIEAQSKRTGWSTNLCHPNISARMTANVPNFPFLFPKIPDLYREFPWDFLNKTKL